MFDNIDKKLKSLAKAITVIGIILGIVIFMIGFSMFASNADCLEYATAFGGSGGYSSLEASGNVAYSGIQSMISGGLTALFSWIGSFFTYALGELIEKVTDIAKNTKKAEVENNNLLND